MPHLPTTRKLLTILAIILLQTAHAQQTRSSEANTIIKQLRSNTAETARVQMLLKLGAIYLNKTLNPIHDMDNAQVLAGQALDLAKRIKFAGGEKDAIFLKGMRGLPMRSNMHLQIQKKEKLLFH